MSSSQKSTIKVVIMIVILLLLSFTALNGFEIAGYRVLPIKSAINLGLDLQGGVSVLLEAKPKAGEKVTDEKMNGAVEVIRGRVDQLGVAEPLITRQGKTRILVELPGIDDSQRALELIGKTASLQFIGPDGKVILTGNNVRDAKAVYGGQNEPLVSLKFDSDGAKKFEKATREFLGKQIAIKLDEQIISAPTVQDVIPNGEAVITNLPDIEKAGELATLIRAGALPVDLEQRQIMSLGPTLGADSLTKSVKAGILGIALIILYMIIYYRVPGLVAGFSLIIYVILVLLVFVAIGATLTLPGIAGFILSIGMAVDANVLIFERLKEELENGKTLRAAIDSGFHRAITTILDSNITTIIAAVVLLYLGTGPVRGFAVTLIIGILVSFLTAVFITRILLVNLVNAKIFTNKKFFCCIRGEKQ
ncbi:MAG TPA: protein translocase subunit SecD [Thermoanaerobacterales bacterium]|nr:protein translocase subunit SecD [Thermoanaerobacterales bacterium]